MSFLDGKEDEFDTESVNDVLAHSKKPKITQTTVYSMEPAGVYGSVYEDPRGLTILKVAAIIAVSLGVLVLFVVGSMIIRNQAQANAAPSYVQALKDQSGQSIPNIVGYLYMSDDDIYNDASSKYTVYQSSIDADGMSLVKLPDGIDAATMIEYYANGLTSLSLEQTCGLLRTGWFLTTNRGTATSVKIKYADFTSGSYNYAIESAMKSQGLTGTAITELSSGVDDNDNNYSYGTYTNEGTTIYWKVACCPLSQVYTVSGLPDDSLYVGVTISDSPIMDLSADATNQ